MNDRPDISVVLATFNRRQCLPRAIASVLRQEDADFELIVVDDASTDDTRSYLATLNDPRVKVIAAERNVGPSAARNRGLAAARADVIAFLDSDDVYRPRRLAASLAGGIPVSLRDTLTGIDHRNIELVITAVLHAWGQRPEPEIP